jgi:CRP/FNR family transcriptional regulator, dissimilatory nitrate respiration regulator
MNSEDREKTCLPLLAEMPFFRGVSHEGLRFIAAGCHTRSAPKGQVLCEKGGTQCGFFCITDGRVKLAILSEEGAERVIEIVVPGGSFGEAPALLGEPWRAYAQALADTHLVHVGTARVREAAARWPDVALAVLNGLSRKVQDLTGDLETCCLMSASRRVAGFLLREATDRRHPSPDVVLPAPKAVVASSLNLTAETFSRELHNLARDGLVDVERRTIRVLSLDGLRSRCGAA